MSGGFGMSKGFGLSVAAGLASGLIYLSVIAGGGLGVLLIYLVPLPLVIAGLSFGLKHAAVGALAAVGLVGLASIPQVPSFAIMAAAPALILVRQALLWRRNGDGTIAWYPPGLLLAWLTGIAAGLLLFGAAILANGELGIEEQVGRHVTTFIDAMDLVAPAEMRDSLVAMWTAMMPAMAACAWVVIVVLNGVLAQWTVAKAGVAIRPTPAYGSLELPLWLPLALAATVAVGLLAGGDIAYLGRNLAVVLAWPYVFAGLATVHAMARGRPNTGLLLALFYVAFFAMFGWTLVAVAGLGLVRHWTRLRRRKAGGGQEEK